LAVLALEEGIPTEKLRRVHGGNDPIIGDFRIVLLLESCKAGYLSLKIVSNVLTREVLGAVGFCQASAKLNG
jgi:hypothetical protein